jgi:cell division protein FtsQ
VRKTFRKPYRVRKKRNIFKNRFFKRSFLILLILGALSYFLLFSETFQIKEILVFADKKVRARDIELVVEDTINKKKLFLKEKNIFLANLDIIKKNILDTFPPISEVRIERNFPDTLNIKVSERVGLAVFCHQDNCFLLDKKGVIFERVSEDYLSLPKIKIPDFDSRLELGDNLVGEELISKVVKIILELEDLKIPVKETRIILEERVNVLTFEGWEIYFNPQRDIDWQLTKLKAVLEKYILPQERENLEYIELRFGDLAPYKYR